MATPVNNTYTTLSGGTLYCGRSNIPAWARALPLWEVYPIPNTALSSCPPTGPAVPGISGPSAKVTAWCGSTLRRKNSEYKIGAAGGHGDYCGNEVNTLVLNTESPVWVETRARSLPADILTATPTYLDLTRSALHTYWATQYDNLNDQMLIVSSGGPGISGVPTPPAGWWLTSTGVMMGFDRATNEWTHPDLLPRLPWGASGSADLCCTCGVTGDIFYVKQQGGFMYKYSPATQTWSTVGSFYLATAYRGSAVDPIRNRMLIVGGFNGDEPALVRSTVNAASVPVTFGGLGPTALLMSGYPGIIYDEVNDDFLVFKNSSPMTVYRVDAETYEVSQVMFTGQVIPTRQSGVQNSVQYVPELKGFVIVTGYTTNAQFVRTAL